MLSGLHHTFNGGKTMTNQERVDALKIELTKANEQINNWTVAAHKIIGKLELLDEQIKSE